MPVWTYKQDGDEIIVVWLTAQGNEALCEVCHTSDQKDVWRFPSFEFAVRKDSLSVSQVSAGSGGITIRLTIDRSVLQGPCTSMCCSLLHEAFLSTTLVTTTLVLCLLRMYDCLVIGVVHVQGASGMTMELVVHSQTMMRPSINHQVWLCFLRVL